ncbi:hypothetical protein VCRA2122O339_70093 [Vibrio crassostreae]|nr:hypothetical protein VCRA2120E331_140094 [Vibrio crassostreae]CAK3203803.1 hypothetical protein VCRA2127O345_140045 [Vibrio crassostreae]CAK3233515.1 hypothetical protein VCRA2120E330_150093 [Vibrio crassostreae]CAK3241044.1 hypothetical protein VCRA2122O338_140045 [Vibrio crassostreae]CAK3308207.1 hypothetical protein VCRA2122O340_140045 [Vibrio crassostreae]
MKNADEATIDKIEMSIEKGVLAEAGTLVLYIILMKNVIHSFKLK